MANTTLQAGTEIGIKIDANQADVANYSRKGDDLFITLKNGDVITVLGGWIAPQPGDG